MEAEKSAWIVALSGLAALAVAMGIGRFAFTPILPMMHGMSVTEGGWLASANYVGYLAGGLSAMWLQARPSTVVRGSLAMIGVVTFGMALTGQFAIWMLLRALAGVASAWVLVFGAAWCLDGLAELGHPSLGSVVFAGVGAGIALAGAACFLLMQAGAGAGAAWLALGAASIVLTAMTWPVFGRSTGAPLVRPASPMESSSLKWTPNAVLLVVCYGVFGFGYIIPATFVPAMAKGIIADPAIFGWSWPVFGVAAMLSTLAAGRFMRSLGNRRVWMVCTLVMAIGVAAPALFPGIGAVMLAALSVGGTFMVVTMAGMQEARATGGAHAKTLMAAMTSSFAAGQIAGPLVVSWQARVGGSMDAVLLAAAVLLVVSAAAVGMTLLKQRKANEALPQ